MRFLVDLYRLLILAMCGLILIGVVFVALSAATASGPMAGLSSPLLIGCFAALLLLVLNLGGVAILMSLHDRHTELAEHAARIAQAAERVAAALENGSRDRGGAA